jgi:hypothetical protein
MANAATGGVRLPQAPVGPTMLYNPYEHGKPRPSTAPITESATNNAPPPPAAPDPTTPDPGPDPGGGGPAGMLGKVTDPGVATSSPNAAVQGLMSAGGSDGGAAMVGAPTSLRTSIGQRIYPALDGLLRVRAY